jgi:hypothetical protein
MEWKSGWEMVAAFIAGGALLMGWYQITQIRKENRVERTLAACSRYESDATVERCVKDLRVAHISGGMVNLTPQEHQHQAVVVLNFLDTIAIGVEQGLYLDPLARDHMESIVRTWTDFLLEPKAATALGIERRDYGCLVKLAKRWDQNEIYYGHGLFRRVRRQAT